MTFDILATCLCMDFSPILAPEVPKQVHRAMLQIIVRKIITIIVIIAITIITIADNSSNNSHNNNTCSNNNSNSDSSTVHAGHDIPCLQCVSLASQHPRQR